METTNEIEKYKRLEARYADAIEALMCVHREAYRTEKLTLETMKKIQGAITPYIMGVGMKEALS